MEPEDKGPEPPGGEVKKTMGEILPSRTLLFRQHVGEANLGDDSYEMTASVSDFSPIVRSNQTGKWFTLGWEDILRLAIAAGVDSPEDTATEEEKNSPRQSASGDQT